MTGHHVQDATQKKRARGNCHFQAQTKSPFPRVSGRSRTSHTESFREFSKSHERRIQDGAAGCPDVKTRLRQATTRRHISPRLAHTPPICRQPWWNSCPKPLRSIRILYDSLNLKRQLPICQSCPSCYAWQNAR